MSRPLTPRERDNGPYVKTWDPAQFSQDFDQPESWFYPGTEVIRPQTRVYRIIGRDQKPTGKIVYAKSEVQAAALRQTVRDSDGNPYLPGAELVDVIYED